MHKAEIISIGSELLSGKTIDTTSSFISRKLSNMGIVVSHKVTLPDNNKEIIKAVKQTWKRSEILVITGGLGSTRDDITKKAVAEALGLEMVHYTEVEDSIRKFYKKLGREIPPLCLNQAILPEGSRPLENSWGTSPGIYLKIEDKRLFMLPGVPHETTNIFTYRILPILANELGKSKLPSCEINFLGIGESRIRESLEELSFPPELEISYLPGMGRLKLVLSGNVPGHMLPSYARSIQNLFKGHVYSMGDVTLEQALGKILKKNNSHLAVAESCTGGLLASRIVSVSGSSSYFSGGVIAYSNKVKTDHLGVSPSMLKEYGAVSIPVALAMATGAAKKFDCECGIGITGVAGPSGGTIKKPVGYVCIASCSKKKIRTDSFQFYGDRNMIREQAATNALFQLLSSLKGGP